MAPDESEAGDVRVDVLQQTLIEISPESDGASEAGDGASSLCCVICLDSISEPCIAQPCAHRHFDYLCLLSWLETKTSCPLCRSSIREVHHEFSSDGRKWTTYKVGSEERPLKRRGTGAPISVDLARDIQRRETDRRSSRDVDQDLPRFAPLRGGYGIYHRRSSRSPPRPAPVSPDEAIHRRRQIYREQLYSLHVGSNRISQYLDLTPELFQSDPPLISRARKWIRRELRVFEYLYPDQYTGDSNAAGNSNSTAPTSGGDATRRRRTNNAEFLLEYVVAILKTVDIQGSCGQAEDMLKEFLGRDHARLFLHELRAFLRSPYVNLEDWDRNVQYATRPKPGPEELRRVPRSLSTDFSRAPRSRGADYDFADQMNSIRYNPYGSLPPRKLRPWAELSPYPDSYIPGTSSRP